jgi:type I restriction enzyme S subunit
LARYQKVGRKGNPGIVTWIPRDSFPIDTTFYVVPRTRSLNLQFLYHVLSNHDLSSLGADSAVPGLNRNLAYMSLQVSPPGPLVNVFETYADGFARRVHRGREESRILSALRDALLPKLISGQLQVRDAERFLERVV